MARSVSTPTVLCYPGFSLSKEPIYLRLRQVWRRLGGYGEVRGGAQVRGMRRSPKRSGLSFGEIVVAYAGLLSQGNSVFDAIKDRRDDGFVACSLFVARRQTGLLWESQETSFHGKHAFGHRRIRCLVVYFV